VIPEIEKHRTELEEMCRRYRVARLDLFGSAAVGRYVAGESDLDFLVEFQDPQLPGYADRYFGLLESLERLFGAPVDLVVASAVRNPFFRQAVEQTASSGSLSRSSQRSSERSTPSWAR